MKDKYDKAYQDYIKARNKFWEIRKQALDNNKARRLLKSLKSIRTLLRQSSKNS